ncbi:hypothetical protein CFC21_050625 [Triticum aestivum]|uniref:F-box domain-containing protein n=2 Tax=Triticum aestivum TaxID=4565 RepID=A0A9R1G5U7_WHEAT|nr:hypothetical protein CFC21_050625 [Triticum aestivum]
MASSVFTISGYVEIVISVFIVHDFVTVGGRAHLTSANETFGAQVGDLLLDILLRVDDAAALFRCAAACKQWRGLVADPAMLRRRWPEDARPSLAGFFIKNRVRDQEAKALVPTPRSALGRRCRGLRSFVPTVPDRAVPLASRRGLLLVRLIPPREADLDQTVLRLAVCNLLLGTCDELPPLVHTTSVRYSDYGCYCCAILSSDDCRSGSGGQPPPFYEVLIVTAGHEGGRTKFDIHTFSTDKPSWSTRRSYETMWDNTIGSFCQTDAVVCHGVAYWLFHDDKERCFRIVKLMIGQDDYLRFTWLPDEMLPDRDHRPCLRLNSDDTLSVLQMQETGSRLQIWRQEGQDRFYHSSQWLHPQTIELIQPYWKKTTQGKDTLSILGEKCGKLLVMDGRGRVYTADLETGAMKEVADGPHARPNSPLDAVLLEMDWPAFFVSRLGIDRYSYP